MTTNEKPILFSGPMVRAILDGRKAMTRRVVQPQPRKVILSARRGHVETSLNDPAGNWEWKGSIYGSHPREFPPIASSCPYGVGGDRLWVRETWALTANSDHDKACERWELNRKGGVWYAADGCQPSGCGGGMGKRRPSIFMPRWASRIDLEIESIRVERLQAITPEDCVAEGMPSKSPAFPRIDFAEGWDRINGEREGCSWADSPYVWVISFRRIKP